MAAHLLRFPHRGGDRLPSGNPLPPPSGIRPLLGGTGAAVPRAVCLPHRDDRADQLLEMLLLPGNPHRMRPVGRSGPAMVEKTLLPRPGRILLPQRHPDRPGGFRANPLQRRPTHAQTVVRPAGGPHRAHRRRQGFGGDPGDAQAGACRPPAADHQPEGRHPRLREGLRTDGRFPGDQPHH